MGIQLWVVKKVSIPQFRRMKHFLKLACYVAMFLLVINISTADADLEDDLEEYGENFASYAVCKTACIANNLGKVNECDAACGANGMVQNIGMMLVMTVATLLYNHVKW